jgi:hypothetical protein
MNNFSHRITKGAFIVSILSMLLIFPQGCSSGSHNTTVNTPTDTNKQATNTTTIPPLVKPTLFGTWEYHELPTYSAHIRYVITADNVCRYSQRSDGYWVLDMDYQFNGYVATYDDNNVLSFFYNGVAGAQFTVSPTNTLWRRDRPTYEWWDTYATKR